MILPSKGNLKALLIALLMAMGVIANSYASLHQGVLSFSPGDGVKPKVQSTVSEVATGARYRTKRDEMREVLLPDGTVLSLGLDSEVVIEVYRYDRASGTGEIALRVESGVVRVVGGRINNNHPIKITTPTAELALKNAAATVSVAAGDGRTRSSMLYGQSLSMTSGGMTEVLFKPGFELVSTEKLAPPDGPSLQDEAIILADMSALETTQLSKLQSIEAGQYSSEEQYLGARVNALATEDQPAGQVANTPTNTPPPNTTPPIPPMAFVGGNASGGYGVGRGGDVTKTTTELPGQADGDQLRLAQNLDKLPEFVFENNQEIFVPGVVREMGRTTNHLFNSRDPFTQAVVGEQGPESVQDKGSNLQYLFSFTSTEDGLSGLTINLDGAVDLSQDNLVPNSFDVRAPFLLIGVQILDDGEVFRGGNRTFTGTDFDDRGSIFKDATHFEVLQAGFTSSDRQPDNFLLVEVRPAVVTKTRRDQLLNDVTAGNIDASNSGAVLGAIGSSAIIIGRPGDTDALRNARASAVALALVGASDLESALNALITSGGDSSGISQFDAEQILSAASQALEFAPIGTERFLFAAGDVDTRLATGFQKQFSVDRFFITAGLENFDQKDEAGRTLGEGIRAFLRQETGLGLTLVDTGLLVVNSASGSADAQNAVLHADFGLEGQGAGQQSTISVTIGDVEYQLATCSTCDIQDSIETVLSGQTVGSSQGTTTAVGADGSPGASTDNATVAMTSPLRSTSAGGGNPALNRDGYAGYFVLENYDPSPQGAGEAPLAGGTERPVGNPAAAQQYAYLRLATAKETSTNGGVAVGDRSNISMNGWVAGLAELEDAEGLRIVQIDSGDSPGNMTLQTNADTNRAATDITFSGGRPAMTLGGLTGDAGKGASAFVDDARFATRTLDGADRKAALVSGDLVKGGLPAAMQASIPEYRYLKWGFFFGDTVVTNAAQREHVHLASWVAGRVPDAGDLPTSGTASYSGHAIGNVHNAGASYTAVGTYNNSWNFAERAGVVAMEFDGTSYTGNTAITNGAVFQGRLDATGRVGGLHGNFVEGGGDPVAGVAGRFSVQETAGEIYRASGTFGAEKTGQ